MFKPMHVPSFGEKVLSIYKAGIALNSGALVDIDTTDTSAITGSVGYSAQTAGSVKLATVGTTGFTRELGVAIPTANATGPQLIERLLFLASSYMTIPIGMNLAVYVPAPGDIIGTTEFVGYLAGDAGAAGKIDTTLTTNLAQPCGVFQGRFRLAQGTDAVRARYIGNTTANGASVAMFQFA